MRAITLCNVTGLSVLALCAPAPAGGVESFWIPAHYGSFHDPANWNGPLPDETVTAIFDVMPPPGGYNLIYFDFSVVTDRLIVRHSSLLLRLFENGDFGWKGLVVESAGALPTAPSIVLGDAAGQSAGIRVDAGTLRGEMIVLGLAPGSSGTIDFRDSFGLRPSLITESHLHVGHGGQGVLTIADGATVDNGAATLGVLAGSSGEVVLTDPDSFWQVAAALKIGDRGQGSVTVSGTADLVSGPALIGHQAGSFGEVTIEGAGTTWTIHGPLDVGFLGEGTFTVSGGAFVVTDSFAAIGTLPDPAGSGGDGMVIVSGPASTWFVGGNLHASLLAQGTLHVLDGGAVLSAGGFVGATGEAVVRGAGSVWSCNGALDVQASLVVAEGGLVSASAMSLDGVAQGDGTLIGAVTNHGTLRPGDPVGTLSIDGDLTLHDAGDVEVELSPGASDSMVVTGQAVLGGGLIVTLADGFQLFPGDCFPVISASKLSGDFDSMTLPLLPAPFVWQVNRGGDRLSLLVGPYGGDLDGDGTVGITDLLSLLADWGPCAASCPADLSGDGAVDSIDLLLLLHGWGPC